MKLISCFIRPDRLPAVKEACSAPGHRHHDHRVSGHGGERDT